MAQDNSSSQLDNESHQKKRQSINVRYDNELKNLSKLYWQNKECKYRYAMLTEKDCDITATWQIDSRERLLIEINKDSNGILTIILDMRNIYIKYLNQANYTNK